MYIYLREKSPFPLLSSLRCLLHLADVANVVMDIQSSAPSQVPGELVGRAAAAAAESAEADARPHDTCSTGPGRHDACWLRS